jgi:hypothetical protein
MGLIILGATKKHGMQVLLPAFFAKRDQKRYSSLQR